MSTELNTELSTEHPALAAQTAPPPAGAADYRTIKRRRLEARAKTALLRSGLTVRYAEVDIAGLTAAGQLPGSLMMTFLRASADRRKEAERERERAQSPQGKATPAPPQTPEQAAEEKRRRRAELTARLTPEEIYQQTIMTRQMVVDNTLEPRIVVNAAEQIMFEFEDGAREVIDPDDFIELRGLIMGEVQTEQTDALQTFREERERGAADGGAGGA
jgi:hypothetical protein